MWAAMAAQAAGQIVSGLAQRGQANRAANAADANAEFAEDQGAFQANQVRERAARLRGSNVANAGASGVDIGSFADSLDDSDISAELDAQMAARDGKQQASNLRGEAKASRASGNAAAFGGLLGAGSSALSTYGGWKLMGAGGSSAPGSGGWQWTAPAGGSGGAR